MDGVYNVSDPTDWINTALPTFSPLENALRCQVCKDFFDTPMITSCSHTFCSLCIRRSLSSDGRCPACRAQEQASKLRRNWAIEEVVSTFQIARPAALLLASRPDDTAAEGAKRGGKRRRTEKTMQHDDTASQRQTRSQSKRDVPSSSAADTVEIVDSDEEHEEQPDDGLVPCPMCSKRMKEELVYLHLDRCEDEQKQARSKSRTPLNPLQRGPSIPHVTAPQERLPEMNYSLLKDNALRKKLQELGIPAWGPKQLLIRRHMEWVNLWNSNCDSSRPRTKRELLSDLDGWERSQGGSAREGAGMASSVMKKDFDNDGWAHSNKDDFSRLIAEATRAKQAATKQSAPDEDQKPDDGAQDHDMPDQQQTGADPTKPYENNPDAMSSIRQKVEAANHGKQAGPLMNEGFRRTSGTHAAGDPAPSPGQAEVQNKALLGQSHFGARKGSAHGDEGTSCDLPAHWRSPPTKRIPMFQVPETPVMDTDGATIGQ